MNPFMPSWQSAAPKTRDHPKRRGLSAATWAKEGDHFALLDFQVEVLNRRHRSETLLE